MFFNDYIQLVTESTMSGEKQLLDKIKHYHSKIINLHKKINVFNYQEVVPSEKVKELKALLHAAIDEYKIFVNSRMDSILHYPEVNKLYTAFAPIVKQINL